MANKATYFISRMTKAADVDWSQITQAILSLSVISSDNYKYTIINISEIEPGIFYGEFAKYEGISESEIIDEVNKRSRTERSENKAIAISPFIYWPSQAAICYQHVWNHIREEDFREYFQYLVAQIIAASGFEIYPVTNEKEFFLKLLKFKQIFEIEATVVPPNPLFGPIWEDLKEYLKRRKVRKVKHKESAERGQSLETRIIEIAKSAISNKINLITSSDFGDKAIFMAMDGYGSATIKGFDGKRVVVLRTLDKQESFKFDKTPNPNDLGDRFTEIYMEISKNREWRH